MNREQLEPETEGFNLLLKALLCWVRTINNGLFPSSEIVGQWSAGIRLEAENDYGSMDKQFLTSCSLIQPAGVTLSEVRMRLYGIFVNK